jgi:hypothetical protein
MWVDPEKNKQKFVDIDSQNIALFVAKKKVNDGMQDVIIQLLPDNTIDATNTEEN